MTQREVLDMFRNQAALLGVVEASQADIILRLAQLLADCRDRLPQDGFDEFVHIGAVMYQEGLGKFRARTEVAETIRSSAQNR